MNKLFHPKFKFIASILIHTGSFPPKEVTGTEEEKEKDSDTMRMRISKRMGKKCANAISPM